VTDARPTAEGAEARRGVFLVIDGPDGAGKTTQVERLVRRLREEGRQATAVRDPGSTPVSERIREVLLDARLGEMEPWTEVFLYMASRAEMTSRLLRPALEVGLVVVSDRFVSSTVAYQGYAGGVDPARIWELGRLATGGLEPDLTVLLDLPAAEGLARLRSRRPGRRGGSARTAGGLDRVEAKPLAYHEKVREGFLAMARERPEAFAVVDAARPPDQVAEAVWEAVARVLP